MLRAAYRPCCMATGATLVILPAELFPFPARLLQHMADRGVGGHAQSPGRQVDTPVPTASTSPARRSKSAPATAVT